MSDMSWLKASLRNTADVAGRSRSYRQHRLPLAAAPIQCRCRRNSAGPLGPLLLYVALRARLLTVSIESEVGPMSRSYVTHLWRKMGPVSRS